MRFMNLPAKKPATQLSKKFSKDSVLENNCLPLEETPLLGEMSQTEGSAVSGEEKVSKPKILTDEVLQWMSFAIEILRKILKNFEKKWRRKKNGFGMIF